MTLVRWRPFRELENIQGEMNSLFENFFTPRRRETEVLPYRWKPVCSLKEDDESYTLEAEIPGLKKEDIKISLKNDVLTVSGERKEEKEKKDKHSHLFERQYGSFCRTFTTPVGVVEDKIDATYKDGILKVVLPKTEEAKVKEIAVK